MNDISNNFREEGRYLFWFGFFFKTKLLENAKKFKLFDVTAQKKKIVC